MIVNNLITQVQTFFCPTISDGRDFKTRSRNGDERQASVVRVFWSGGETQTAVSGQRVIWYQRSGQVSSSYTLHLLRMQIHSSPTIALFKSQHEQFDLSDFITDYSYCQYSQWMIIFLSIKLDAAEQEILSFVIPHILSLCPYITHNTAEPADSSIRDCSELC